MSRKRGIEKAVKAIFIATAIIIIVSIVVSIVISVFVVNNPEAIGDWFRRLIGGQ